MIKIKRTLIEIVFLITFIVISVNVSNGKSIWRDEAFSLLLAQNSVIDIIRVTIQDFNPPIFYILLHFWIQIFGTSELMVRLLPLTFMLGTIVLMFKIRGSLFKYLNIISRSNKETSSSKKVSEMKFQEIHIWMFSIIYYLLIVSSNVLIYFSAELRPYAMQIFLVLLSSILSVRLIYLKSRHEYIWLMLTNSLLIYTHTMGIMWVASQGFAMIVILIISKKWKFLKKFLLSSVGVLVLSGPWIWVMIEQMNRASNDFWILFDKKESWKELIGIFIGMERLNELTNFKTYLLLFKYSKYLIYFGSAYILLKVKELRVVVLSFFSTILLIYYYSYYFNPILYSRYISLLAPIGIILVFIGFVGIYKLIAALLNCYIVRSKLKRKYINIFALFFILFLFSFYINFGFKLLPDLFNKLNRTDYKELSNYSDLTVYTDEELDVMSCMYYSDKCVFVGDLLTTHGYVGAARFASIKSVNSWQDISQEKFVLLYKDYHRDYIFEELNNLEYKQAWNKFIGDNSNVGVFERR